MKRDRPEYGEAEFRAYCALGDAARADQRIVDPADEAEAVAIHRIAAARVAIDLARYLTVQVPGTISPANLAALQSGRTTLRTAIGELSEAFHDVKAAYHESLAFHLIRARL